MGNRPPVVLTIAGSDPSGGAGIQADLKTFSALGAFGTSVLTALTAQNTQAVTGIHPVPPPFVAEQLQTLTDDIELDAVKIGMLAGADLVQVVHDFLLRTPQPRVVLDPVMVATSGDRLLDTDAVEALRGLLPVVDLITPNLAEAGILLDAPPARDLAGVRGQARALLDLGARRVLLKGGHLDDPDLAGQAVDLFCDPQQETTEHLLTASRVDTRHTHGTGCSLSSAITALVPRRGWLGAVTEAKSWLTAALGRAEELHLSRYPDRGHGPVHHFHALWP